MKIAGTVAPDGAIITTDVASSTCRGKGGRMMIRPYGWNGYGHDGALGVLFRDSATPSCTKRLPALPSGRLSCATLVRMFFCLVLSLFFCDYLATQARAAENLFNSGAAIKREMSRVSEQGKLFVSAPVDPYLRESAALAGIFALSYLLDKDTRSELADAHSGTLNGLTDFGNLASNPFLHIGVAAALYGAGAVADEPEFMRLGEELGEALFLADGASFVLKEAIGRGRPHTGESNSRYRPFQFKSGYGSLPSMHTASSFAVAHVLASKTQSLPVKVLCYAAAGFAGFSRVYQDKHWLSDVVLGAAIGELAGDAVTRYYVSKKGDFTIAPLSIGGVPSLALMGKF